MFCNSATSAFSEVEKQYLKSLCSQTLWGCFHHRQKILCPCKFAGGQSQSSATIQPCFLVTSINLLFAPPLDLLPASSILSILLQAYWRLVQSSLSGFYLHRTCAGPLKCSPLDRWRAARREPIRRRMLRMELPGTRPSSSNQIMLLHNLVMFCANIAPRCTNQKGSSAPLQLTDRNDGTWLKMQPSLKCKSGFKDIQFWKDQSTQSDCSCGCVSFGSLPLHCCSMQTLSTWHGATVWVTVKLGMHSAWRLSM